jgi:phenylacetate-CoA ligase
MSDGAFPDARELRDPVLRERDLFSRLPAQVAHAKASSPYFASLFAGVDPAAITNRAALATLPLTRKSQLAELQRARLPFGGLAGVAPGRLARIFMSPGPIYDPEGRGSDYWRTARALHAAGFRAGDVVLNCYAYHLSPAGSMFETGLHRLGCAVIPGGTGNTEQQARAIGDLRPAGYVGTPSFVKILLEKCDELGIDSSSIGRASVSGEALMPVVREFLRARGVEAFQSYGTADLGLVAYETPAREGLVVDEEVIVEIVRPGTGEPVAAGEVGEVVVTTFSAEYPLVRLATGDLSAVLAGTSPCGRTNMRIKGWMGRADQSAKVRGLFVHPHQVAEILRRHGAERGRLVIENEQGEDRMTFKVVGAVDARAMEASLRDVMKVRGEVVCVDASALPNDGKVIEDLRKYA